MINLRDKGAQIWENWNRPSRTIFVLAFIALMALLPFAASWGPTSFLNTPITSFQDVLVYPVGMFILMALGLNIVVGKSGLLDLVSLPSLQSVLTHRRLCLRCWIGTLGRFCLSE